MHIADAATVPVSTRRSAVYKPPVPAPVRAHSHSDHDVRVSEERVAGLAPMTAISQMGATSFDGVKVGNSEGQILMFPPTES